MIEIGKIGVSKESKELIKNIREALLSSMRGKKRYSASKEKSSKSEETVSGTKKSPAKRRKTSKKNGEKTEENGKKEKEENSEKGNLEDAKEDKIDNENPQSSDSQVSNNQYFYYGNGGSQDTELVFVQLHNSDSPE